MSSLISFEEFSRLDIRVGIVKEAVKVPGTRLLRILVDLGELGERQIVAGIGDYYDPEGLKGMRIIVVANLKPKKIKGYVSEGMLLAAGCGGRPYLLLVDGNPPAGSKVC